MGLPAQRDHTDGTYKRRYQADENGINGEGGNHWDHFGFETSRDRTPSASTTQRTCLILTGLRTTGFLKPGVYFLPAPGRKPPCLPAIGPNSRQGHTTVCLVAKRYPSNEGVLRSLTLAPVRLAWGPCHPAHAFAMTNSSAASISSPARSRIVRRSCALVELDFMIHRAELSGGQADLERLRETGVLDLRRLLQGVVSNSNADCR